jgi:hypothetical protein
MSLESDDDSSDDEAAAPQETNNEEGADGKEELDDAGSLDSYSFPAAVAWDMLGSVDPFASQMIDCDTQAPFSVDPGLEDDGDGGEEDERKEEAESVVPVAKVGVRQLRRIIAEEEQEDYEYEEEDGDNEEEDEREPKESRSRIYVTPPKRKATREEKTARDDQRKKKRRRRREKMSEEEEEDEEEVASEEPAKAAKVGSVNNKFRLGGQPSTERPNDSSKLQWRLNAKPDPLGRRLGREDNEDDDNEGEAEAESSIKDTIEDIDHEEEPQRGTSIHARCCCRCR